MRRWSVQSLSHPLLSGVLAAALSFAALPVLAADLALKRVILSTGGVGYFEYEAVIDGASNLELTVRRDQVDDVLKSIVVYDDKGGVGDISLPGEDPLRDAFRELPFDQSALQDTAKLLEALKGAEVTLGGATALKGRIIGVSNDAEIAQGRTLVRPQLSVLTTEGLRTVALSEAGAIAFVDPKLKAQVETGLNALATNRARERRALQVRTTGQGQRTLRVAFVVEAPLWKAAYRLTLGTQEAKTAEMQGWAVLENRSGEDWRNVELTLVSGNPVTFRQALYTAYYVRRPDVPVEVLGRVLPRADAGAVAMDMLAQRAAGPRQMPAPASAPPAGYAKLAEAAAPTRPADVLAASATEASTQASYKLPHAVSLANGHSLMVPLIARTVPAERLSLYQPDTQPRHPLASVQLTNDSGVALPPGVLTLYEREAKGDIAFVGDARLNPFPAGEKRLVSFAVDQKVSIARKSESSTALSRAKLSDGLLRASMIEQFRTTYTITGATAEPRRVMIEHARTIDGDLTEPKNGVDRTDSAYRAGIDIAAGKTGYLTFTEERVVAEEISLTNLSPQDTARFIASGKLIEQQRQALTRLGELAQARGKAAAEVKRLTERKAELEAEQARIRANLGAVPSQSDLHRRYLTQLGEQEDRIGKLAGELAQARDAAATAEKALGDYIRGLNI